MHEVALDQVQDSSHVVIGIDAVRMQVVAEAVIGRPAAGGGDEVAVVVRYGLHDRELEPIGSCVPVEAMEVAPRIVLATTSTIGEMEEPGLVGQEGGQRRWTAGWSGG